MLGEMIMMVDEVMVEVAVVMEKEGEAGMMMG